MRRLRDRSGQASGEYVALVALVAVVLALAAGLTSGGIGGRVLAGLQRGLCLVAGGACPRPVPPSPDLAPCPIERSARSEELTETIASLRLGTSGTLSAARTSDGRVTVTLANGSAAGAELGAGARLRIGGASLDGAVRAGATATWASGRSWTLPDEAAARRFVAAYGAKATIGGRLVDQVRSRCSLLCDALGWRPHPHLPAPDETYEEGGALASLRGSLGLGRHGATAGGELATILGRRLRRDGASTWYVRLDGAASARLRLPVAGLASAARAAAGQAVVSYDLDAHGEPVALGVHLAGEAEAHGTLGRQRAATRPTIVELDATLDLRDPGNRAAAAGVLGAGPRTIRALPARVHALARRIARDGQLDVRTYALRHTTSGLGATLGLGIQLGGGFERTTRDLRLLSAETRLPGLPFLPRDDCRPA